MLHMHFGTGRLGLGLAAPFFQTPTSELYLLNRESASQKTGEGTAFDSARRNELLMNNSRHEYFIETPGASQAVISEPRQRVRYNAFHAYGDNDVESIVQGILGKSREKPKGIVVTASVMTLDHYAPVVDALNAICRARETAADKIGEVYLIACENTVSANEVERHHELGARMEARAKKHVRCVHALVDRVCAEVEECLYEGEPTVVVRAEEYGSVKLEVHQHTQDLPALLEGSRVEFSRHLDVEKEIKLWLLNGSHWLIALTAFRESNGNVDLKLNDFINSTRNHSLYAAEVVREMRDGIEVLLRTDPQYAGFIKDVDAGLYLDGAAASILERFKANDDTIERILTRFRAPTPDQTKSVESFVDRFLNKIESPMLAYEAERGLPPKSISQGVFNLFRLQASGTYVDTGRHDASQAA